MAILSNNEARGDYTHVLVLDHNDLINIGNGGTLDFAEIPPGGAVELCGVYEAVAVAGTTTLVIDVGTEASDNVFIDSLDVDAMSTAVFNTGTALTQAAGTTTVLAGSHPAYAVAASENVRLTLTDANIANITAGKIVIGLRIADLGRFA